MSRQSLSLDTHWRQTGEAMPPPSYLPQVGISVPPPAYPRMTSFPPFHPGYVPPVPVMLPLS